MTEKKTCPDQRWQQLPTEELDQILQAELEKEHPDEEVVLPILHELQEREKDRPVEKTPEVLQMIEKLQKHETSSKQPIHKSRWIIGVTAIVTAACFIVLILPRTVGAESLFDVLVRWTNSIFEFLDPDNNVNYPEVGDAFVAQNPGLQELYDKITAFGVTEAVVPTWLPEDFVLSELKDYPISGGIKLYVKFTDGTNDISITYRISTEIKAKIEKSEMEFEVFEAGGVSHFVIDNGEILSVTWRVDGVECVINGNVSKEDMHTIIKSIYRSELTE